MGIGKTFPGNRVQPSPPGKLLHNCGDGRPLHPRVDELPARKPCHIIKPDWLGLTVADPDDVDSGGADIDEQPTRR